MNPERSNPLQLAEQTRGFLHCGNVGENSHTHKKTQDLKRERKMMTLMQEQAEKLQCNIARLGEDTCVRNNWNCNKIDR